MNKKLSTFWLIALTCLPMVSRGGSSEGDIIGAAFDMLLFILNLPFYLLTILSSYYFHQFQKSRLKGPRNRALTISIIMFLYGIFALFVNFLFEGNNQYSIGFFILINLLIFIIAPWMEARPFVEALLGRLDEDKKVLTWVGLKRSQGKVELTFHRVLDLWRDAYRIIYSFKPFNPEGMEEKLWFDSYEEGMDYVRKNYKQDDIRFVKEGRLQEEYKELIAAEKLK